MLLETPSCSRLITELSSRRISYIGSRSTRVPRLPYSPRQFTNTIRRRSETLRQNLSPSPSSSPPPPPQEYVPTAKELSQYVNRISRSKTLLQNVTEPYLAYGGAEKLFIRIAQQADYSIPNASKQPPEPAPKNETGEDIGQGQGIWFASRTGGGFDLPVTFLNWSQIIMLHMYVLTVRIRQFPADHTRIWDQHLLDHFMYAAEDKMEKYHGMHAKGIRQKHLKDLWQQWRGLLVSYDEGLIKGDAMLGAAIWRAIFKSNASVSIQDVALVTAYLRQELQRVDAAPDAAIAAGHIQFGDLAALRKAITTGRPSP